MHSIATANNIYLSISKNQMIIKNNKILKCYVLQIIYISSVKSFWPPPYNIDLKDNEEFVISEDIEDKDDDIFLNEDEMIKEEQLEDMNFNKNSFKFHNLHQMIKDEQNVNKEIPMIKYNESNFDSEESIRYKGAFLSNNTNEENDGDNSVEFYAYLSNKQLEKNMLEMKNNELRDDRSNAKKRNVQANDYPENYDYLELKKEYEKLLKNDNKRKETLHYKKVKEEETPNDALGTMLKRKDTINCTLEEMRGIGTAAFLCLLKEPSQNRTKIFFSRLLKIATIWFIVYLVFAIPLWCQKGWCCCCFRCMFCRPYDRINKVKEYFAQNPPGIGRDENNDIVYYEPTTYEKYYQKKLEHELANLD